MSHPSLLGLKILNTRAVGQNSPLSQTLRAAGATVLELPALVIEGTENWYRSIPDLNSLQQAIFTSRNAVYYFFEGLRKLEKTWPESILITAIGEATADELQRYGLKAQQIPLQSDSEHLLALSSLVHAKQDKILLVKGLAGRTLIAETLNKRGFDLVSLEVYQRSAPKYSEAYIKTFWQEDCIDIILIYSQETMQNLLRLFKDIKARRWLLNKPWLVFSERQLVAAQQSGAKTVLLSSFEQLLDSISAFKKDLSMENQDTENTVQESQHKKATKKSVSSFIMLLSFAALLAAAYAVYINIQFKQGFRNQTETMHKEINSLQESLAQNREQMLRDSKENKLQQERLQTMVQTLETNIANNSGQLVQQEKAVILSRIEYYLELAQLNNQWSNDSKSSLLLLQLAEQLCTGLDPNLSMKIRPLLAESISKLQATTSVDRQDFINEIQTAESLIKSLVLKQNKPKPEESSIPSVRSEPKSTWQKLWQKTSGLLNKLVRVRYQNSSEPPLLSQEQLKLLQEQLRLSFQEAQWALLQNDNFLLKHSLQKAKAIILSQFDENSPAATKLLAILDKLQNNNTIADKKALAAALASIQDQLKTHHAATILGGPHP